MTKSEYLKKLKRALRPIERAEREKSLAYFSEVIDDRIEEGITEEAAVAELESVSAAAERIISEAKAQGQIKQKRSIWEIVLIVLGFPLWFPFLLTLAIIVLTVYGLVWIIIGALFLISAALVVGGVSGIFALMAFFTENINTAFAGFGAGLICAGIGIALFIPALYFARSYARVTPTLWHKLCNQKEERWNTIL